MYGALLLKHGLSIIDAERGTHVREGCVCKGCEIKEEVVGSKTSIQAGLSEE
jgi:hypothetical protein